MIPLYTFATDREKNAFEYIYAQYKRLLLHKAWEILRDYALAEDAVSEAFLRLYRNIHKIDDPKSNASIAFVVTIVRNVALTMLSYEQKKRTLLYEESELDDRTTDSGFDLEGYVLSEMSSERIMDVLNKLPEDARDVFLLKHAYDLPHKKIAALLHISENNVTVKLHRAKKKLAAQLEKEGYAYGKI